MTLTPQASRTLAIALFALIIALVLSFIIMPYAQLVGSKVDRVTLLQERLGRYQQLLATAPDIEANMARLSAAEADNNIFLQGNKAAIASANLREHVDSTVRNAGGLLVRSQEHEAPPLASTTPVGLQLNINGEIRHLVSLLHALEESRPLLLIDEFELASTAARTGITRSQRRAKASSARRGSLDIRMNVVGYLPGVVN